MTLEQKARVAFRPGDSASMAKPANSDKATASKMKQKKKLPQENPALRWQLGGLIAGVIVAIISMTEPGKKVRCF